MGKKIIVAIIFIVGLLFVSGIGIATKIDSTNLIASRPPAICTDSDGGKNYNQRGITYGTILGTLNTTHSYIDVCTGIRTLREYYCYNTYYVTYVTYVCPTGHFCANGACR